MHEEREKKLLCQNIKTEYEVNNEYKEEEDLSENIKCENGINHDNRGDQDPLAVINPVAISFEILKKDVKKEEDAKEEYLLEDAVNLQNTFSESECENTDNIVHNIDSKELLGRKTPRSSGLLQNSIPSSSQMMKQISKSEGPNSSVLENKKRKKYVCQVCKRVFSEARCFKNHSTVHMERKFVCDICGYRSFTYCNLENHIKLVHFEVSKTQKNYSIFADRFACGNCNLKFNFVFYVKEHIQKVHSGIGNYTCCNCNKSFTEPQDLKKHAFKDCKNYKCQVCNKEFKSPVFLKKHSILQCGITNSVIDFKIYECQVCFKQFSHPGNLKVHSVVHKEKKFMCSDCNKRFREFSGIKNHIRIVHSKGNSKTGSNNLTIHKANKIYACDNCDQAYSWAIDLKNHIKVAHLGVGHFKCTLCSKTFSKSFRLKRHLDLKHKIKESNFPKKDKKFSCGECNKRYCKFFTLKKHITAQHLLGIDLKCEQCKITFSATQSLEKHMISNRHKNFRKFECDFCKKKFSHLSLLSNHIVIHSRTKSCVCKYCGKGFFIISKLKHHIDKMHLGIRNYQCDQCGKSFFEAVVLAQHINIVHKKLRIYECQFCYKTFQQIHHLQNHIICVHERVKNFVCEQCGDRFLLAHHLRNHVNAIHKGIRQKSRTVK